MNTHQIAPPTAPLPEQLTTAEVAAVLRCSPRTVYRLIRCGTLPDVGLAKKHLFPRALIEEFLTKRVPGRVGLARWRTPSTTSETVPTESPATP